MVSFVLSMILYPLGIMTSLVENIWNARFRTAIKQFDKQLFDIAASIDANGNVVCDNLFNLIWITKDGYKFGNRKETISSVLGKNQEANTLSWLGIGIASLLDLIDTDHCKKSIDLKV